MSRPTGSKNSVPLVKWSEEEKQYLSQIANGKTHIEITYLMNEKFDREFTKKQVSNALKRYKIKTGITGQFEKGHTPFNKGKKGVNPPNSGCFKKGQKPKNWRPVGSERVNAEGYTEIKVKDEGTHKSMWRLKHHVIYEEHNGSIPKGYIVIFGDKDRSNFSPDNLILISRKQSMILNKNRLIQNDTELTKTAINVANLMLQIGKLKKENNIE